MEAAVTGRDVSVLSRDGQVVANAGKFASSYSSGVGRIGHIENVQTDMAFAVVSIQQVSTRVCDGDTRDVTRGLNATSQKTVSRVAHIDDQHAVGPVGQIGVIPRDGDAGKTA